MFVLSNVIYGSVLNFLGMENVPMRPENRQKKKPSPSARRRLPENYVCIAPDEAQHVIDFIIGSDHRHEEIAKLHFHLCLHCQEKVARLHLINKAAKDRKELLHPATNSVEQVKLTGSNDTDSAQTDEQGLPKAKKLYMKAAGEI